MSDPRTLEKQLGQLISPEQLITDQDRMTQYTTGIRVGHGQARAVVMPQTLVQLWQILQCCVDQGVIIIMQASNTGVTGGSTPDGDDYDRPVVILSTRSIKGFQLIDDNRQVIALPGSTLTELEDELRPLGREPHSVLGSSCIGASVIGGICNNSGGSLIRRGPAFTEKSLFARVNDRGQLELVNHLGIDLGRDPEEILDNLISGNYRLGDQPSWEGKLWADDYPQRLREVDADTPARFNGDVSYLHDSAGSAGKVAVFAVRLPTFEASQGTDTFYIGAHRESDLVALRRYLLQRMTKLPQQAEYIHREAFDMTLRHARHVLLAIRHKGPGAMPDLMDKKAYYDWLVKRVGFLPRNLIDRCLQLSNRLIPHGVAPRIMDMHDRFEHNLMIKVDHGQQAELDRLLDAFWNGRDGEYFHCNAREQDDAFLVRFGVGGCTIAYCQAYGISPDERLLAFDVAMRRNDDQWRFNLPQHLQEKIMIDSCCGHFFCFVNHQDYILKPGVDADQFKQEVLQYLESRGARYPAEHNVGHLYQASQAQKHHWQQLDPCNACNPGIGKTSKQEHWV